MHDPSLVQNRCFLYHLIGNGTGEWRVPVGGMGAVTDALARGGHRGRRRDRHRRRRERDPRRRRRRRGRPGTTATAHRRVTARYVLVERRALGAADPARRGRGPGDQAGRAPSSRSTCCSTACRGCGRASTRPSPSPAPCTSARTTASSRRRTPTRPPAGSRRPARRDLLPLAHRPLDPRRPAGTGTHTLTYFGVHTPAALFEPRPRGRQAPRRRAGARVAQRAPRRADRVLPGHATPTATRASRPRSRRTSSATWRCPAATSSTATSTGRGPRTAPGWTPRRSSGASRPTSPSVLVCGSGARRGGAVSGLGGHNAAQAVLAVCGEADLDFLARATAGRVHVASPRRGISSIGRAADS